MIIHAKKNLIQNCLKTRPQFSLKIVKNIFKKSDPLLFWDYFNSLIQVNFYKKDV